MVEYIIVSASILTLYLIQLVELPSRILFKEPGPRRMLA